MAAGALHPIVADLARATPRGPALSVYIHVPFCAQRCHYCSFNTAPLEDAAAMARYVGAARRELALLGAFPWVRDVGIATVFFGGGTPSLLGPDDLASLLDAVRAVATVARDAEITVECNPESVDRAKLAAYRGAGVTRVSLGVQSLDDVILARLGRLHDAARARAAFDAARAAGFDDVSIDLMYGLPGLTSAAWRRTVETALDWQPDHLSAYGLTLDAGSRWGSAGVDGLPAEDEVVEQYWTLVRAATARGFEHYEISNYARAGHRSRHNLVYWRAGEYVAVGPGACGFLADVRYGNAKPVTRYCTALERGELPIDTAETLSDHQRRAERLFLGLRTSDGVPRAWLDDRTRGDAALRRRIAQWRTTGLLIDRNERVALTEAGFLVSDALFVELL